MVQPTPSRAVPFTLLLLLGLSTTSHATELDAWKPGAASGQLQDPLAAHAPWALETGGTGLGIWAHALKSPLYGADIRSDAAEGTIPEPVEALTWLGPTGLHAMWRPASGAPFDIGGRARFRALAQNPGGVQAVRASGGLTDASGWLRFTPAPLLQRHLALTVEGNLDPDTLGTQPESSDIAWMSGAGTGMGATLSVGSAPSETGLHRWSALGLGVDLRSQEALSVAGELSPTQSLELQGGLSWVQPTHAWLAELHARGGRLAPGEVRTPGLGHPETAMWSASLEGRVGIRWKLSDLWRSALVVGAGLPVQTASGVRIQPTGSPALRLGFDVQRVGKPPPPPPPPTAAGAGELVVIPVNQAGEKITFLELPGMQYRVGPESERIATYTPGTPVTVSAAEYASLTMVPQTYGPGPWVWSPVLVPRQGNALVRLNLSDTAGQGVETSSFSVGGVELGQIVADTLVVVEGLAPGAIRIAAAGPLIQSKQTELVASDVDDTVRSVVVDRPVGAVRVRVTDNGAPIAGARWKAWDGTQEESGITDTQGMARLVLPVGLWQVRIEANGFGAQEQTLRVQPDDAKLQTVPFTLMPLAEDASEVLELTVFDGNGDRISDATIELGEKALGQTVSGGRLRVEGLKATPETLKVGGSLLRDSAGLPVKWSGADTTRVEVPMAWKAGAASLQVHDPEGAPIDGVTARVVQPDGEVMDPMALGPDGYLQTILPPGKNQLILSAAGYGIHTYDLDIPADQQHRLEFDVVMSPIASVGTRLVLRIIGSDGNPVSDSRVLVDGQGMGSAPTTGPWVISDLKEGAHDLRVEADTYEPWTGNVSLTPGDAVDQKVPLRRVPGIVRLEATHSDEPVNATVRMVHEAGVEGPVTLGPNGRRAIEVEAGSWQSMFAASDYGVEVLDVKVKARKPVQVRWEATPINERHHLEAPGPRDVQVRLIDAATGTWLAGRVRVMGPAVVRPDAIGTEAPTRFGLETGNWELFAEVPGRGVTGHKLAVGLSTDPVAVEIPIGRSLVEVTDEAIQIAEKVHFASGRATIESSSDTLLDAVASTLRFRSDIRRVVVEGHTDNVGSPERNQTLSEERAAAVRTALIARGVSPDRLVVEAYGESRPIASNDDKAGREMNRRVVFRIVDKKASPDASPSEEAPPAE